MSSETRWLRLTAIIPSAAMAFMDQSILPVALPVIQKELGANNTALQWTVNAYLLAMAVFILTSSRFSCRRLGLKSGMLYRTKLCTIWGSG